MNPSAMYLVAEEWIDAFNRHDIKGLLDLYHDNASHYSPRIAARIPGSGGWRRSREEMEEWWQGCFDRMPDITYYLKYIATEGPNLFMTYSRTVHQRPDQEVMEYFHMGEHNILQSRVLASWAEEDIPAFPK